MSYHGFFVLLKYRLDKANCTIYNSTYNTKRKDYHE